MSYVLKPQTPLAPSPKTLFSTHDWIWYDLPQILVVGRTHDQHRRDLVLRVHNPESYPEDGVCVITGTNTMGGVCTLTIYCQHPDIWDWEPPTDLPAHLRESTIKALSVVLDRDRTRQFELTGLWWAPGEAEPVLVAVVATREYGQFEPVYQLADERRVGFRDPNVPTTGVVRAAGVPTEELKTLFGDEYPRVMGAVMSEISEIRRRVSTRGAQGMTHYVIEGHGRGLPRTQDLILEQHIDTLECKDSELHRRLEEKFAELRTRTPRRHHLARAIRSTPVIP